MKESIFNLKDFENKSKNVIQMAVDECYKAGGGTVVIPEGEWITGPIHFKSNVHLKLEENSIVKFSDKFEDYLPVVFTRWEGMECYNYSPLIYAKDCENISITGKGVLLGNGEKWWNWKKLQQKAANELCYAQSNKIPVSERIYGNETSALRPSFIQTINCKNVLLEDFTIKNGPQWTIHPVYCDGVIVRGVEVITKGPNTDGLNPDSCSNVLVENCIFETGDDCIAINSGMNEDGWRVNKPCENIEIRNCIMNGGHGAIVIGSAMSGGVKHVYAHDCKIYGTMQGIRLKSMRGRGGYVEDVVFENIEINDVSHQAIQINMFYEFSTVVPKTEVPSKFSNITIKNIYGKNANTAIEIKGLPECKLSNLVLENINLMANNAFICDSVENIILENINISTR